VSDGVRGSAELASALRGGASPEGAHVTARWAARLVGYPGARGPPGSRSPRLWSWAWGSSAGDGEQV